MNNVSTYCRLAVLGSLLLSGCITVGPDYQTPKLPLPEQWTPPSVQVGAVNVELAHWWQGFSDPQLNTLIASALAQNLDIQATKARLRNARAAIQSVEARFWPEVAAASVYQRQRISPNSLQGVLGSATSGGGPNGPGLGPLGTPFDIFRAGFDSNWELDLFGGIQRQQQAAMALAEAALESQRDVQVSLTSEVAQLYFSWLSLQQQESILHHQQEQLTILQHLGEVAYAEGLVTLLEKQEADLLLQNLRSKFPALQIKIATAQHQLEYLCGLKTDALAKRLRAASQLPAAPQVPLGLPAELLRRRPDIRLAERKLAAASELLGVAIAEQFPKLALTGNVGLQSQELSNFANMTSGFYGFGPRISLPVFQMGRIASNITAHRAQLEEAQTLYEKSVTLALREVADALSSLTQLQKKRETLQAATQTAERSATLAIAMFNEGESDLKPVLQNHLNWDDLRSQQIANELDWIKSNLALYKALGGGWQ